MKAAVRRSVSADVARTDRALSLSQLATQAATDSAFTEAWASVAAWNPSANNTVSGGKVYGNAGPPNPGGGARNVTIASGSRFRYVGTVDIDGGGTGFVGIGICTNAAPLASGGTGARMWGLTGAVAQKFSAGSFTNMTDVGGSGGGTSLGAGAYRISVTGDESGIRVSITNAARTVEYTDYVSWATAGAQASIVFWNSDTRGTSGCALRGLAFRLSTNTSTTRGVWEDVASEFASGLSGANTFQVRLPADYSSTVGSPLCIYFHGSSGTAASAWSDTLVRPVINALVAAGYIVLSVDTGNDWGNQAAQDLYYAAYQYVRDHYAIKQVFHLGQSMGGLASLNTIAARRVPAAAWCGIYPACNLDNMYTNTGAQGNFAGAINTAYGISGDYAAKTAGYDPMLKDARLFRTLPMMFFASTSDTVVRQANNTDAFRTLISGTGATSTLVQCTGEHGDTSHFQPTVVVNFFETYRYEPPLVPAQVTGLSLTHGSGSITATWTAPSPRGSAVTDYVVQYRTTTGPGAWQTFADGTSTATTATITGLANGTSYDVQVAAVNGVGQGAYSSAVTDTPSDTPGGVSSGLAMWFKADTLGLADGTAVSTWADQSGNALDLTQATSGNRPLCKTAILNGLPVVRFDGVNDYLIRTTANALFTSSAYSIFVVAVPRGGAGAFRGIVGNPGGTTNGYVLYASNANTLQINYAGANTGTGAVAVGTPFVGATTCDGSNTIVYLNGASAGSRTATYTPPTVGGEFIIGANRQLLEFPFSGDVAEVVLYNRVVNSTERAAVTAYLGAKYGITVV